MFGVRALVRALNDAKNYAQQGCAMQFNGITLMQQFAHILQVEAGIRKIASRASNTKWRFR